MKVFKELYQYRELLKTNVKKEIRGKYKGSFLGILWSFVNPLLMVLVYAIVFPFIMRSQEENYVIFLITAVIPWNWFTTVVSLGTTTILGNGNIIKKVYFPREILPISIVTSGFINFLISCIIILIFLIGSGIGLSFKLIYLPVIIFIQYIFSLGLIFILSAINVYVRDVEYIVNFLMSMLFYMTPVLYNASLIPQKLKFLFYLNPMTHIINAYRDVFFYQTTPDLSSLSLVLGFSLAFLVIGYIIFKQLEKGFAEEL